MTSIIVFIAVTIMAIFTAISIYKIINARVTYKKYYPYRKLVMVTLISLPWIFLVFRFYSRLEYLYHFSNSQNPIYNHLEFINCSWNIY